ncbi:hypothetical protein ACIQZB_35510 [Streptomyces sp. NPDC097727]
MRRRPAARRTGRRPAEERRDGDGSSVRSHQYEGAYDTVLAGG